MRYIRSYTTPSTPSPLNLLRRIRLAALVAIFAVAGAAARANELTVCAASSLAQAFREVAAPFEAAVPGARVRLNFGASGALLQQVARGAPCDVLAVADLETMERAQALGLVDAAARRSFASNRLVVVVPLGQGAAPQALADLARPEFRRIAVGLPGSVPAGRYAQDALAAAGLWQALESRVVGAASVRQALDYVARGEVDAGFVYATDAARQEARVRVVAPVEQADPVRYPAAVVAASAQPAVARAFVAFLTSPPAQAVLVAQGFGGAHASTAPPSPREAPR